MSVSKYSTYLTGALFVSTLFNNNAIAALPPKNNTGPLFHSMDNIDPAPKQTTTPPSEPFACPAMTEMDFFNRENLAYIDQFLGTFKNWIEKTNRLDEQFAERYFGKGPLTEEQLSVISSYDYIYNIEGDYVPGTPSGRALLNSNPETAKEIIHAYAQHAAAQKYMLDMDIEPEAFRNMDLEEKLRAKYLHKDFTQKFSEEMMALYETIDMLDRTKLEVANVNNACPAIPLVSGP